MLVDVPGIPLRLRDGSTIYALVDPEDFVWLNEWRWNLTGKGKYVGRGTRQRELPHPDAPLLRVLMHRQILELGPESRLVVDHVNGNGLDNRRSNLRVVTRGENTQNVGSRRGARSAFRGVFFNNGKWVAQGRAYGVRKTIGYFATEHEAGAAAAAWRAAHMPFSREALSA